MDLNTNGHHKLRHDQLRTKRLHILSQLDNLGKQYNEINDWRTREVIKQQIFTLGQELVNVKGKHHEL